MKEIKSTDTHGGWSVSLASSGIRGAVLHALCQEFHIPQTESIELSPLRLLNYTRLHINTFTYRARIGARVIIGTAKMEIAVYQPKIGEEYVSTFAIVSYQDG